MAKTNDAQWNMTSTLERLELFRDRVRSALYDGQHPDFWCGFDDNTLDGVISDPDEARPLSQVIKAVKHLVDHGENTMKSPWVYCFLRRIERKVRGLPDRIEKVDEREDDDRLVEQCLCKPWRSYLDETELIRAHHIYQVNENDPLYSRHANVCMLENELEQRKRQSESIHGRRKTIRELCREHDAFLTNYLGQCISRHSYVPVHNLSVDDDGESVKDLHKINREEKQSRSRTIQIPIRFAFNRLREVRLLSFHELGQEITAIPFFPSRKETFLESAGCSNVTNALGTCRWMVVLGDPGCGKTTLLRWLTLQLARSLAWISRSFICLQRHLDKWQRLAIRFGRAKSFRADRFARLPILVRVSELVAWLDTHPKLTIMDYIEDQTIFSTPLHSDNGCRSCVSEFIHHGHALLLFDGLDEVSNHDERRKIVNLIEKFVERYVRTPGNISIRDDIQIVDEWGGLNCEWPKFVGGNQVIITSRVVGYYLYPIKAKMFTLFDLTGMNEEESDAFVDHWLLHVSYRTMGGISDELRKEKRMRIKRTLRSSEEKIWSHAMLLSLVLPLLYETTRDVARLGCRIGLYDLTIKFALETSIRAYQSILDSDVVDCLLYDMAFFIHTHCPSGLIDTFDLNRLLHFSLTELYKNKEMKQTKSLITRQAGECVRVLTTNSIGFMVARGLDAYGFIHRTFQEYLVALHIVKPHKSTNTSELDRLFAFIVQPNFRESLKLALEWLNWTWNADDFNTFCLQLVGKFIGPLPVGALLLTSVLENLSSPPSLQVLKQLFSVLMAPPFDKYSFVHLAHALTEAKMVRPLIEYLLRGNVNNEDLCRFCIYSLPQGKYFTHCLPHWLSETLFVQIESFIDKNERVELMIDSVCRRIRDKRRDTEFYSSNDLQKFLMAKRPNIQPLILSLLTVLCGGLHYFEYELFRMHLDNPPKPIQFTPDRMHRTTALADVLLNYFASDTVDSSNVRLEHLITQCHQIVATASFDDVSGRVVDAIIALICLGGCTDLSSYEYLLHYHALPRALLRMRLALYHMGKFYHKMPIYPSEHQRLLPQDKVSEQQVRKILDKYTTIPEGGAPNTTTFLIAMCAAYSRLHSHALLVNKLSLTVNEGCCSAQALHLMLNIYSEDIETDKAEWSGNVHPFQLHCTYPLFPVAFITSRLRPIYERLVINKREKLSFVVVLAEVLQSVDEIVLKSSCKVPHRILLLLRVLEDRIRQYHMQSYSQAIVYRMGAMAKCDEWYFGDYCKDMAEEGALELLLSTEQKRLVTESDWQRFAVSIGLTRAVVSLNKDHDELIEQATNAASAIRDPLLKLLCLRHLREIVRPCLNTKLYCSLQNTIASALENMSIDNISLLTSTLILVTCADGQIHPSSKRLADFIWSKLQCAPTSTDDELDQTVAFQTLQHTFGHLQTPIPRSFLTRPAFLQLNSAVFRTFFQNASLDPSETVALAQLYLTEVTVDAHLITQLTKEVVSPFIILPPPYGKEILRHSWKTCSEIFSHRQISLINSLLLSSPNEFDEIPFDQMLRCCGFAEQTDRPIIESWLAHHSGKARKGIAILAAFLLVRSSEEMTPETLSTVEMILQEGCSSTDDSIRRGARACFKSSRMNYRKWSTPMWQYLRNLMVSSLLDQFGFLEMPRAENLKSLLAIERERLSAPEHNDLFSHVSLLSLIDETFDNDGRDIQMHLSDLMSTDDHRQDEYLASILIHIVRRCEQKTWCNDLFDLLDLLLYKINLPQAQLAAVYALAAQKRGREMLLDKLDDHFNPCGNITFDDEPDLSESQLAACMIALSNTKETMPVNTSSVARLIDLKFCVAVESVRVQRHFQAFYLSHVDNENGTALSTVQRLFKLTVHDMYILYTINTSCFPQEWREFGHWGHAAVDLIVSHKEELLTQFIDDLYGCLSIEKKENEFLNPQPNYLFVAKLMIRDNSDTLSHAVRASSFGEKAFKTALCLFSRRTPTAPQRDACIGLYASFRALTQELIEMAFAVCLEDFSSLQWDMYRWADNIQVADREDIETIFSYLKSPSMCQRRLALTYLVRLVELDLFSIREFHELLLENDVAKLLLEDDEFNKTAMWNRLVNSEPLGGSPSFESLTAEEVYSDFSEMLQMSSPSFV